MKKAIGIYGGCFDPFHRVHAMIAKAALNHLPIERLLVVPTAQPWHKRAHAGLEARINQCKAALAGVDGVEMVDDPAPVGEDSTTAMLLEFLQAERKRPMISIVGGDAFAGLTSWRRWKEALDLASWAVVPRLGYEARPKIADLQKRTVADPAKLAARSGLIWHWKNWQPPGVSSSDIRELAAEGNPDWDQDLPQEVVEKEELLYIYSRRTRS